MMLKNLQKSVLKAETDLNSCFSVGTKKDRKLPEQSHTTKHNNVPSEFNFH